MSFPGAVQRAELERAYGAALVASRLAFDVFTDASALQRQLAYEARVEITPAQFESIVPHAVSPGQRVSHVVRPRDADDPAALAQHHITHIFDGASEIGIIRRGLYANGDTFSLHAAGRFGLPAGWSVEDRMTSPAGGPVKLRSRLCGPAGESGMVVRSFDGETLFLDKAYKSTLPTRLSGVQGLDRPAATINYLTARACRILGVTSENLRQIKVNRLQNRPVLAHLDWLHRQYPQQGLASLLDQTTWARTYIRQTAEIVGNRVQPEPSIDLQGSPAWCRAHPQMPLRDWHYFQEETERLTIKHLTGEKIARVDDPQRDWRASAAVAIETYKTRCCAGLDPAQAQVVARDIDELLARRLAALRREEGDCRQRYDLPADRQPHHLNFDVTFRTLPMR